jgi:hypothetical protein
LKTISSVIKIKPFHIFVCLMVFALLASTQPVRASHLVKAAPPAGSHSAGWQVSSGPGGEPRFTRAPWLESRAPEAVGDEYWDDQFLLGVNYQAYPTNTGVFAIAVSGNEVYLGGDFDHAGNISADQIAKWNNGSRQWSALGRGVNSRVWAIAARGDDVYVGGDFTQAGGISAMCIAHWNDATQTWSALGGDLDHTSISPGVRAIAIAANGDVYVGGNFETAGGLTVNNIARWDGSSWHALGSGVAGTYHQVYAIAINGSDVYVGGLFQSAGGLVRNNVARWNGSAWSSLGEGTNDSVDAIAINGSNVYIGGEFEQVTDATNGMQTVGQVAMWNGSVWSTMGGGVDDHDVYALAVGSDGVYAGGRFTHLADGTTPANRIARWDGAAWHVLGNTVLNPGGGVDNNVYALGYHSGEESIFTGGFLETAGSYQANYIARWVINANQWYGLGSSVNGPVYALAKLGDDIYVGGDFSSAGGIGTTGIARWNTVTHTWAMVGSGVEGCSGMGCSPAVYAIAITGGLVYVGGNFTSAGGVAASRIAVWNPAAQSWSALEGGVFGCSGIGCGASVRTIKPTNYYGLVVGGRFDYAGSSSTQVNNIAVWSGGTWHALGDGTNDAVFDIGEMTPYYLYVGGAFTTPYSHIAMWDGGEWFLMDASDLVNDTVYALDVSGATVYAGGAFTDLSGPNGDHIAVFHDNNWYPLDGGGLDNSVYALDYYYGKIYAGGEFTTAGVQGVSHIAQYENNAWSGFGSGTDAPVQALLYDAPYLYVGGSFMTAGGKPSSYFGRWAILYPVYLPVAQK